MIKGIGNKDMFLNRQEKIIIKNKNEQKHFKNPCSLVLLSHCVSSRKSILLLLKQPGCSRNGVRKQFFDNNGNPLSQGTVNTYIAGTSTPKTTWQNAGQTIVNTNPIVVLDIAGRAIIYGTGTYRQVVKDKNANLIWDAVTQPIGTTINQSANW